MGSPGADTPDSMFSGKMSLTVSQEWNEGKRVGSKARKSNGSGLAGVCGGRRARLHVLREDLRDIAATVERRIEDAVRQQTAGHGRPVT